MSQIPIRASETAILQKTLSSKRSELPAIYGRRRIGKTHLIRHFFSDKGLYFEVAGLKDGDMEVQLRQFANALGKYFLNNIQIALSNNSLDAHFIKTFI